MILRLPFSVRHSWYQNSRGKVTVLSPWRLVDFWRWTREPDLSEYSIT